MNSLPALPVALADERRLWRTILRLAVAGALAGPVLGLLGPGPLAMALALAGAFVVAGYLGAVGFVLVPPVVALLGLAGGALDPGIARWPLLAGMVFATPGILVGALARPATLPAGGLPRPLVAAIAGAATVAGGLTAAHLSGLLAGLLPPLARFGAEGALVGFYAGLGTLAAHLGPAAPPSLRRLRRLARTLSAPDLADLVARAASLHGATLKVLAAEPDLAGALRTDLDQVAGRVGALAARCDAVDTDLGEDVAARLDTEIGALARLAEASADAAAAERYRVAGRTLLAQADQVRRLRTGRERAVAALHAQVALLERTQLSLVALRASDSGRLAEELSGLSSVLEDVTRELEAKSDAFLDLAIPEGARGVV